MHRIERLESIGFCWKIRQDTSPMSLKKALQNDPMANIPVDIDLSQVFISQESDADCIISYSYRHRWVSVKSLQCRRQLLLNAHGIN